MCLLWQPCKTRFPSTTFSPQKKRRESEMHITLMRLACACLWPCVMPISPTQPVPAARMRLHVALCAAQSACWHVFPQYCTDRHPLHSFSLPSNVSSADSPQCAHAWAAPRARRPGLALTRDFPSRRPGLALTRDFPSRGCLVTGASDGCARVRLACVLGVSPLLWQLPDPVVVGPCGPAAPGISKFFCPSDKRKSDMTDSEACLHSHSAV
jgi:hypothetical protein